MATNDDEIDAQFLGLGQQNFRNALLPGFQQCYFGLQPLRLRLRQRIGEQLAAGVGDRLESLLDVERRAQGAMLHAEQGFIGNVHDV